MWAEAGRWSHCFLAAGRGPVPGPKLTLVCAPEPRNVPGHEPRTNGKLSRPTQVRVTRADPPRLRATFNEGTIMSDVLHVVHPRAAGLDVHKMQITATVRLCAGHDCRWSCGAWNGSRGLGHFDAAGFTRRIGDTCIVVRRACDLFG